jgi:hypothetical protein
MTGVGALVREGTSMLKVVHDAEASKENTTGSTGGSSLLDAIVRDGARQMLAAALQAEVAAYVAAFADEHGRRLVIRNGSHEPREVMTAAGERLAAGGIQADVVFSRPALECE